MPRQQIITLVSVVAILVGLVLILRPLLSGDQVHGDNNANLPQGAWYLCDDPQSPHEFHLTVKQLSAHYETNYGKPESQPRCPTCGKAGRPAYKCHSCSKLTLRTSATNACAHCAKPFEE